MLEELEELLEKLPPGSDSIQWDGAKNLLYLIPKWGSGLILALTRLQSSSRCYRGGLSRIQRAKSPI